VGNRVSKLGGFPARKFTASAVIAISLFILVLRVFSEINNSAIENLLLRAEAKCPGLPFGQYSAGPDYIDLAIDGALAVVAAVFIALTIRDLRRRRKGGYFEKAEDGGEEDL